MSHIKDLIDLSYIYQNNCANFGSYSVYYFFKKKKIVLRAFNLGNNIFLK